MKKLKLDPAIKHISCSKTFLMHPENVEAINALAKAVKKMKVTKK